MSSRENLLGSVSSIRNRQDGRLSTLASSSLREVGTIAGTGVGTGVVA